MQSKLFFMNFCECDSQIIAKLYLTKLPLNPVNRKSGDIIKTVFSVLNICVVNSDIKNGVESQEVSVLYESIRKLQEEQLTDFQSFRVNCDQLKPKLRPYQETAVKWMLHREKAVEDKGKH